MKAFKNLLVGGGLLACVNLLTAGGCGVNFRALNRVHANKQCLEANKNRALKIEKLRLMRKRARKESPVCKFEQHSQENEYAKQWEATGAFDQGHDKNNDIRYALGVDIRKFFVAYVGAGVVYNALSLYIQTDF